MDQDTQQLQTQVDQLNQAVQQINSQLNFLIQGSQQKPVFNVPTIIDVISQHNLRTLMTVPAAEILVGTQPQTSTNYSHFFIADRAYQITDVSVCYTTPSSSGTVTVFKTAPGGIDTPILNNSLTTASAGLAGVPQFGQLVTNTGADTLTMKRGDRLRIGSGGTLTSLVDLIVVVFLRPI